MSSKDLSIFSIFIVWQSNFETALAIYCAAIQNLQFVTAALVLKSLPTPALESQWFNFHLRFQLGELPVL